MPPQETMERPPLTEWLVEQMRLTVFPSPSAEIKPENWWRELAGEEPESQNLQPRKGGRLEEGAFDGGKLILAMDATRIDWRLEPLNREPVDAEKTDIDLFPMIGVFPEVIDKFLALMYRWFQLETYPPAARLAFGTILLQPVENRITGYQRLASYLHHVSLDIEGSSDFVYRINRARTSKSELKDLQINRLSTWILQLRGIGDLSVALRQIGESSAQYRAGSLSYACRLELDINTAPEYQGEFSASQSLRVLQELVDSAAEIARDGDIK